MPSVSNNLRINKRLKPRVDNATFKKKSKSFSYEFFCALIFDKLKEAISLI